MDSTYGRAVSLAVPVFVTLIAVEFAADRMRGARTYRLADSINNLSCGIVSTGVRVFFGILGIFVYQWLLQYAAPVHLPATGAFSNWIFYVPMALCGIPIGVFALTGIAQLFYQFWPHTRLIGRLGILDRWIQTPSNHRVHHAQNDIYLDKNYVGVFVIWDHLFGSFQEELDQQPPIYGIRGQLKSWNPVWANLHYYWLMAQDSWRARSWRDKFYIWIAPPGWRPADVTARFPKPAYDPHRDFTLFDPPRSLVLSIYALVQFSALMLANSHFLLNFNLSYFLYILASLVTLGGVLENRREFILLETARLAATGIGVIAAGAWFGGVSDARILVAIAVFAALSLFSLSLIWLRPAAPASQPDTRPA